MIDPMFTMRPRLLFFKWGIAARESLNTAFKLTSRDSIPNVIRHMRHIAAADHARIVNQKIELAKMIDRAGNNVCRAAFSGNICLAVSQVRIRPGGFGLNVYNEDAGAFGNQFCCRRATDAAIAAGNNGGESCVL